MKIEWLAFHTDSTVASIKKLAEKGAIPSGDYDNSHVEIVKSLKNSKQRKYYEKRNRTSDLTELPCFIRNVDLADYLERYREAEEEQKLEAEYRKRIGW